MPFCSFADGAAMFDVTPIENMFLLEYLPLAPEDYLRVYLHGRMLCLHPELGGDLAAMARTLRMDDEAVMNALRYWEREGLVQRMTDNPPTFAFLPMRSGSLTTQMDRDYYEYQEFNADLQSLFGSDLLRPQQFNQAHDWLTMFGFSQQAALRLVEHELSQTKSRNPATVFKRVDKTAVAWAERGVRTLEDVERAIARDDGAYQAALAVVRQFSLRRQPTAPETAFVHKWLGEWGYSREDIIEACSETTKASNPSFAYLDAVLKSKLTETGDPSLREGLKRALSELGERSAIAPAWVRSYQQMLSDGFEPGAIELAATQLAARNRHRFEDLEWRIGQWKKLGLLTAERAGAYIRENSALSAKLRKLYELCGLEKRPTMSDLDLYKLWSASWNEEILCFAAECARGKREPISYMKKLLDEWLRANVRTVEDARAQNEQAFASFKPKEGAQPPAALNYEQRTYKQDDFGDDFFFDVVKEYGGGEGA